MALTTRLSTVAANAEADAVCALASHGFLRIYEGAQPVSADTAPRSQLLAELAFGSPAFGPAVEGVATANAIAPASATATGLPSWFRVVRGNGTMLFDGSVGTSGSNLNLTSVALSVGVVVQVDALTFTAPRG
jgi:hypothetical protein